MSASVTRSLDHTMEAAATWESTDSTGSILTDVQINCTTTFVVSNSVVTENDASVAITLSVANEANNYFIVASAGPSTSEKLVIDPALRTAHLVASFDLTDLNGQPYTATANVTWHAIDAVQTNVTRTVSIEGPGIVSLEKTVGDSADAVATGTVTTTGTSTSPAIADATPSPSYVGNLQKINDGTFSITYSLPPKIAQLLKPFSGTTITLDGTDLLQKLTGM